VKPMLIPIAAALSMASAPAGSSTGPAWPNTGIAERQLVGSGDAWPESMFVEHTNGKRIAWVLASPGHGHTKALDFFSGRIENVTVQNPGGYADAFVDSLGITHRGTLHPVSYFKDPRPDGAIGHNVHVNVSSLQFGNSVSCKPELNVSERLSDDFQSTIWRKVLLYPGSSASGCPSVPWDSIIGTGMGLGDGTMLVPAGHYVFRVSVDDLSPVGVAPDLHVVDESDLKKVIERAKGKKIEDGSAYLTESLSLNQAALSYASSPQNSERPPRPDYGAHPSTAALSTKDPSQLVDGYLGYIYTLSSGSDVSFDRIQTAVGGQLRHGEAGSGDASAAYPEGDWVTLSFADGGVASERSAFLHFGSARDPNDPLPYCRLPFDKLRDRLLRAGYAEGREWGELGEVLLWTFSKTNDAWVEVSTRWARPNDDLMCAWTIYVRGNV
jgi:hypothetical protein